MTLTDYKNLVIEKLEHIKLKRNAKKTTTWLPGLQDIETRQVLMKVLTAQFARWEVHPLNLAVLLGLSGPIADAANQPLPDDPAVLERAGHLLAIDRALSSRFPYQPTKRDRWISSPLESLDDKTPLESMLEGGLPAIKEVRVLAESRDDITR